MSSARAVLWSFLILCTAAFAHGQGRGEEAADSLDREEQFADPRANEEGSPVEAEQQSDGTDAPRVLYRARLTTRAPSARGYRDGTYAGSVLRSLQRLRLEPVGWLSAGAVAEKDPGERRWNDFQGAFLRVRGSGLVRAALVGDYVVEAGQGLLLWRGRGVGTGADVAAPVVRAARGVIPSVTASEDASLRGVAVVLGVAGAEARLFVSRRELSAILDEERVVSFAQGGYFRTGREIARRANTTERVAGLSVRIPLADGWEATGNAVRADFSRELLRSGPGGAARRIDGVSGAYGGSLGAWRLFGEWGSTGDALAGASGLNYRPSRDLTVVAAYHHYGPGALSPHGVPVGGGDELTAENGLYAAARVSVTRGARLSALIDRAIRPPGPGGAFSEAATRTFVQLDAAVARRARLTARYAEARFDGVTVRRVRGLPAYWPVTEVRRSLRLTLDHQTAWGLRTRSRLELSGAWPGSGGRAGGVVFSEQASGGAGTSLRYALFVAFFRVDSYDARIALAEPALVGESASAILVGRGMRYGALVRWAPEKSVALSARCVVRTRDDLRRLGSGADEVPGNRESTLELQVDLAL